MKTFLNVISSFILILPNLMNGQTVSISGTVNVYTPVTFIDTVNCPSKLTVGSAINFSVNDEVLVIQMKGAKFDTNNVATFGNLINLNGAGSYEIAKIKKIVGNVVTVNGKLVNPYNVAGRVQMVRIPKYTNANVNGVLSCLPWNDKTGGVLIFRVQNVLSLAADIDVSGAGFRGGIISKNPDGSCGTGVQKYHYNLYQGGFSWAEGGAQKGEGIGDIDTARQAGKGPLVNGGGGGNKHNNGGGGGANFTAGGNGGNGLAGCNAAGGIGGKSLGSFYSNSKIFMGGGGGCGDDNNMAGSDGVDGGGIVIIMAGSIVGNAHTIKANGKNVVIIGSGIADGAGGGGGGGSIFLNTGSIAGNLTLQANGGDGGDQSPTYGCVGPGGGGGAGAILTSLASLGSANASQLPGVAGIVFGTSFSCNNTTFGAMNGTGNAAPLFARDLILTPDSASSCDKITSINKEVFASFNLVIYPDPANSSINWNNDLPIGKDISATILDYTGRVLYSSTLQNSRLLSLEIGFLQNGVYQLQVSNGIKVYSGRFVKN